MLNTQTTIEESKIVWSKLFEEDGITEEDAMSSKYDYLDEDEA